VEVQENASLQKKEEGESEFTVNDFNATQINAEEKSEQQQEQQKDMNKVHNIPQTHPQYEQQQRK